MVGMQWRVRTQAMSWRQNTVSTTEYPTTRSTNSPVGGYTADKNLIVLGYKAISLHPLDSCTEGDSYKMVCSVYSTKHKGAISPVFAGVSDGELSAINSASYAMSFK